MKTTDALPLGLARHLNWSLNDAPPCDGHGPVKHQKINIYRLTRLDSFITAAIRTPHAPTRLDTSQLLGELDPEARKLSSFFRDIAVAYETYSPSLEYAPHLKLFFEAYTRHTVSRLRASSHGYLERLHEHLDAFNDFYATFRHALRDERKLHAELHNWRFSGIQNNQRLHQYLDNYIQKNRNVTAMHFTLFHTAEQLDLSVATTSEQKKYLTQLSSSREAFFNGFTRKRAYFPHKPGYVWAVDPSHYEGYGLRITLLFNTMALTNEHPYPHLHAHEIGAYWVSKATNGRGHYHLHPACKFPSTGPAFDRINVDEPRKLQRMKEHLECMALHHALVRVRNQPKGKFFGTPQR